MLLCHGFRPGWIFVVSVFENERKKKEADLSNHDKSASFFSFPPLRLGQGLVNRCNQLSQILWGGFMYDCEQVRPLFIFVAQIGEKGFQLHAQHIGKQEQSFHAGGVGAGFKATDGFGVKTGFFAKFSLSKPRDLAVTPDG
ncbi:hypothetical protein J2Y86_005463 [Pseudomonas migulae]|nr:hypothetical protein [Pseudomonas migulae]